MQKSTIAQLNQLNADFYTTVANSFDDSRNHYWPGWNQLLAHINPAKIFSVLDIGCGNGRFGMFAKEQFPNLTTYTGLDNNSQLLESAKKHNPTGTFIHSDSIVNFLSGAPLMPSEKHYDLIVIFGVMHHIPSFELRAQLLKTAASLLTQTGMLVFTTWQFMEFERFKKKIIDADTLHISKQELEETDYFLDWRRGPNAVRYCHYYTTQEVAKLLQTTHFSKVAEYRADGKEASINAYYLVSPQREA